MSHLFEKPASNEESIDRREFAVGPVLSAFRKPTSSHCFTVVDRLTSMNTSGLPSVLGKVLFRLKLRARCLNWRITCRCFDRASEDAIQQIYVINLDRQRHRFDRMRRELSRLRDRSGLPLIKMTRRFSAVDARYIQTDPHQTEVLPQYSVEDQFHVDPYPGIDANLLRTSEKISMTRQEVGVALSHIAVWKQFVESGLSYCLVLEDDVYFRGAFPGDLDNAWKDALERRQSDAAFDLLYVSFKEVRHGAERVSISRFISKPIRGLWYFSGYILSAKGAKRLLQLLPVCGPVDLWINHQFALLDVISTTESLIEQRDDSTSGNSYSILPILSRLGILESDTPQVFKAHRLRKPIFVFGAANSDLADLTMALSMLGYRCCPSIARLPNTEHAALFCRQARRVFDAYAGIASFGAEDFLKLAKLYPTARFIFTDCGFECSIMTSEASSSVDARETATECICPLFCLEIWRRLMEKHPSRLLTLRKTDTDKWETLSNFLDCEYPTDLYPSSEGLRSAPLELESDVYLEKNDRGFLVGDSYPWIAPRKNWTGIRVREDIVVYKPVLAMHFFEPVDLRHWMLRDDTFPGNLSVFKPDNLEVLEGGVGRLNLRAEQMQMREFTSAAVTSRNSFRYGKFSAELKPASSPGIVTGFFLHRNSPKQEIDFEFLGKDTSKALLNVYYNPGQEGTRMEHGYRGTPALVDLGFDAALAFHLYEIEWNEARIRWLVDGHCIHERMLWDPTPIPHLPMQLHVNIWHARSEELAGRIEVNRLPVHTDLQSLRIQG